MIKLSGSAVRIALVINEIHRQNAVVMLAHPYRFWFNNGNFVSNMANEIALDIRCRTGLRWSGYP